jgi:hypothetical protein
LIPGGSALDHAFFLVFNLRDVPGNDVEYFYGSWLPQDAKKPAYANDPTVNPALGGSGVNDYHLHPTESWVFRLTYSVPLKNLSGKRGEPQGRAERGRPASIRFAYSTCRENGPRVQVTRSSANPR